MAQRIPAALTDELYLEYRLAADDYPKFMDFLRHHRLKPEAYASNADGRETG